MPGYENFDLKLSLVERRKSVILPDGVELACKIVVRGGLAVVGGVVLLRNSGLGGRLWGESQGVEATKVELDVTAMVGVAAMYC